MVTSRARQRPWLIVEFSALVSGLADHPTAGMLAVAILALGWLSRARVQEQHEFLELLMKKESEHRETLEKVIPAIGSLTQSAQILERLIAHKE